ncbi:hypothetical protein RQP46_002989 [Phenoliferia psychrophenolica]
MARGGAAKTELDALKAQVASLKKANSKLKHKVARLEMKLEAADLEGSDEDGAGASEGQAKLRGMLDRFRSLMEEATIGEEDPDVRLVVLPAEECPICFDGLKINEASSLPCEHVYCTSCLSSLSKTTLSTTSSSSEDEGPKFPCPACRQLATVDDAAVVTLTETDRWNALLEISVEFARWGDEVDGEEEEEEDGEGGGAEFGKDESGESEAEEGEFRPAVPGGGRRRNRSIESDEEQENDNDDDEVDAEVAAPNSPKKQKLMDLAKSRARGKR